MTTSADGRITLHHNVEWLGDVHVVICARLDGTNYGTTIPAELLLSGDFDYASYAGDVSERLLRRAVAMAVASAAISAVQAISTASIKDVP